MEPYTPEDERQAISRAHRLGQTRTVHVYRVTMAGTIEESLLSEREALTGGTPPAELNRASMSRFVLGEALTGAEKPASVALPALPVSLTAEPSRESRQSSKSAHWQDLLVAAVQRVARETRGEAVSEAWAEAAATADTAPTGGLGGSEMDGSVSPGSPRRRGKRRRSLPRRKPRPRVLTQQYEDDDEDDQDQRCDDDDIVVSS
jgi:hypothetical protein